MDTIQLIRSGLDEANDNYDRLSVKIHYVERNKTVKNHRIPLLRPKKKKRKKETVKNVRLEIFFTIN